MVRVNSLSMPFMAGLIAAAALMLPARAQRATDAIPGSPMAATHLLMLRPVQQELKLDARQLGEINHLRAEFQDALRTEVPKLPQEQRQRRADALYGQQEARIVRVLDGRQITRLKQIDLQQNGARAIVRDDVAAALRLNDDQRNRAHQALADEQKAQRELMKDPALREPAQQDALRRKITQLHRDTDAKLIGVLNSAQRRQFEAMQGSPFSLSRSASGTGP